MLFTLAAATFFYSARTRKAPDIVSLKSAATGNKAGARG